MDSNGTLDSLSSLSSFFNSFSSLLSFFDSFVGLCLSAVIIVVCVSYRRKYQDLAGNLMLAGKLLAIPGILASPFLTRSVTALVEDPHWYTTFGWTAFTSLAYISGVGGLLFLVGFGLLVWSLIGGRLDIDYINSLVRPRPVPGLFPNRRNAGLAVFFSIIFLSGLSWFLVRLATEGAHNRSYSLFQWPFFAVFLGGLSVASIGLVIVLLIGFVRRWPIVAVFFFLFICPCVEIAILYRQKYKDRAGYLLLTGSVISFVSGIFLFPGIMLSVSSEKWIWIGLGLPLLTLAGMAGELLFTAGFWMLIKSLIAGPQEEIAHGF